METRYHALFFTLVQIGTDTGHTKTLSDSLNKSSWSLNHSIQGCMGIFLFDQSSNHMAFAADALIASRMTLSPKIYDPKNKILSPRREPRKNASILRYEAKAT